ncbi:hypothetical protein [Altericroceibacterium endophyticum]|uniref:Uncharacterized protein n=1 Tax=Altericroceibacterium endophyticum TaxID=1808508 RepID=A0A6I4T5N3_9SPHN|nr:hypothetical protein [Altericroceibacterium endophyticum]MXO65303.1 hypothetical protein [Altericroceibacterium endophyticum]
MTKDEREQIELILDYEFGQALQRANKIANQVCARNSAAGCLQSGATIKEFLRLVREDLETLLDTLLSQLGAVSKERKAAIMLSVACDEHLDKLKHGEVHKIATVASGRGRKEPDPSAWDTTEGIFRQMRDALDTKLRIASYDFKAKALPQGSVTADVQPPVKNVGGKPRAEHWDRMWAEIAVQLWQGDLNPKTQADIEKAMLDWFAANKIKVGESTVRQKARLLWQRMGESE